MKRLGTALTLALCLGLWGVAPATAQYGGQPTASVASATVSAGGSARLSGSNWCANSRLTIDFDGAKIGTVQTDGDGDFSTSVRIPSNASPGAHTITVSGLGASCANQRSVDVGVTVAGAGGATAFTGSNITVGMLVLAGLVILGIGSLVAGRRTKVAAP